MWNKIIFIVSFLVFILSCSEEENVYRVREYRNASTEPIEIEGLDSIYASNLCLYKDIAVIQTASTTDFFHVVDWQNKKLLWSFGALEGSNAIKRPRCYCQFIEKNDSIKIIIRDLAGNWLNLVNIHPGSNDRSLKISRVRMPDIFLAKTGFLVNDKSTIVGNGGVDGIIFSHQISNNVTTWSNERPSIESKYDRQVLDLIYTSESDVDEENSVIVTAYRLFNRIDIFDFYGAHKSTIYFEGNKDIEPIIENDFPSKKNTLYFIENLVAKEGNIFLLFSGKTFGDFLSEKEATHDLSTSLQIIDLEGNLIDAIKIPYRILTFAVGDNNKKLYGLTDDDRGVSNIIQIE